MQKQTEKFFMIMKWPEGILEDIFMNTKLKSCVKRQLNSYLRVAGDDFDGFWLSPSLPALSLNFGDWVQLHPAFADHRYVHHERLRVLVVEIAHLRWHFLVYSMVRLSSEVEVLVV